MSVAGFFENVATKIGQEAVTGVARRLWSGLRRRPEFCDIGDVPELMDEVVSVIQSAERKFWCATAVPALNVLGQTDRFGKYRSALLDLRNRGVQTNILWFSERVERLYLKWPQELTENEIESVLKESRQIRAVFKTAINCELPALGFQNFWMGRDKSGTAHSVNCWFGLGEGRSAEIRGFYTTSEEMAEVFLRLWNLWHARTLSGYADRFWQIGHATTRP
jgi:hypothetical protein